MAQAHGEGTLEKIREFLRDKGVTELGEQLGSGGQSGVYRGLLGPTPVAIKVSHKPIETSDDVRSESQRGPEIWPLTRAHEGLVRFITHFLVPVQHDANLVHYLVSIWPLARSDLAKQGPSKDAASLCDRLLEVADAIDFLNSQRVFHRDVKPANILEFPDGKYRLSDLGSAKTILNPGDVTGTFAGTNGFGPPEMVHQYICHSTIDVYGLATTVVASLTGEWHFGGTIDYLPQDRFALDIRNRDVIQDQLRRHFSAPAVMDAFLAALEPSAERRWGQGAVRWLRHLQDVFSSARRRESYPTGSLETGSLETGSSTQASASVAEPTSTVESRLESLGLTAMTLETLVRNSIGVASSNLPMRILDSLSTIGAFRAKEVAFELLHMIRQVQQALNDMRSKIEDPEPHEHEWVLIKYDYDKVAACRQTLRSRIDRDCDQWRRYTIVAVPIWISLDRFSSNLLQIMRGYVPRNMAVPGQEGFQNRAQLTTYADKVEYYVKAIDRLASEIPSWERECEQFYVEHCRLFDP